MKQQKQAGFTLMELMIVVAIIGIIAAVAFPSYQESVAKSKRADAQGSLMAFASAMERYYTQNNTYGGAANGGGDNGAPDATVFPSQTPIDSPNKNYNLTISSVPADGNSYLLLATPIVGSSMGGDRCGTLRLSSTGAKSVTGSGDCWK